MNERMSGEALLAAAARGVKGGLVRLQLGQAKPHWSPDGGFLALLDCTPELFARTQGGDPWFFLGAQGRRLAARKLARARRAGRVQADFPCYTPAGQLRWLRWCGVLEAPHRWRFFCLDIGRWRQMQRELEGERERRQVLLRCTDGLAFEYDGAEDVMTFCDRRPGRAGGGIWRAEGYLAALEGSGCPGTADFAAICRGKSAGPAEVRLEGRAFPGHEGGWFSASGAPVEGPGGRSCVLGVLRDISAHKKETQKLRSRCCRDPMTRLYNKLSTAEAVDGYLQSPCRGSSGALLLIDLDDFKGVNDRYGHQFGDAVLTEVSARLRANFRATDIVGRVGGDEFVVFMKDAATPVVGETVERLCQLLEQELPSRRGLSVRGSIGVALWPRDGASYETLFAAADRAMYEAKRAGKDRYRMAAGAPAPALGEGGGGEVGCPLCLGRLLERATAAPAPEEGVRRVLADLGDALGAHRTYFVWKGEAPLHVWTAPGVAAGLPDGPASPALLDRADLQPYYDPAAGLLYCPDAEAAGESAPRFAAFCRARGARAVLQCRVAGGGRLGLLGAEVNGARRYWNKEEVALLKGAARICQLLLC
ncbi:GGDEF domain-containing protein [bacterium 210820-DFI.6.52]|nr:GGDEF domain-containing protein [bacterium 210820-DFI.6.52]